jgi:hypothetical protein
MEEKMLNEMQHNEINKKFLQGGLNQWVSGPVGQWVSGSVGKGLLERSLVSSHWSLVSDLRGLKASIPGVQTTFFKSHNIRHFDAFTAKTVQLKKPSGGPKGLIGPPCHGALAAGGILRSNYASGSAD